MKESGSTVWVPKERSLGTDWRLSSCTYEGNLYLWVVSMKGSSDTDLEVIFEYLCRESGSIGTYEGDLRSESGSMGTYGGILGYRFGG
jgi:hypothetical protein